MKIPLMRAVIGTTLILGSIAAYMVAPADWFHTGCGDAASYRIQFCLMMGVAASIISTLVLYLLQPEGLERLLQTELDQENKRDGIPLSTPSSRHTPQTRWLERALVGQAALFFLMIMFSRVIDQILRTARH